MRSGTYRDRMSRSVGLFRVTRDMKPSTEETMRVALLLFLAFAPMALNAQRLAPVGVRGDHTAGQVTEPRVRPSPYETPVRLVLGLGSSFAGAFGGAMTGLALPHGNCHCDDPGLENALVGAMVGAVLVPALVTALPAMSSECSFGRRFGLALAGSAVGAALGGFAGTAADNAGPVFGYIGGAGIGAGLAASLCHP
jgi:hypothetical protein